MPGRETARLRVQHPEGHAPVFEEVPVQLTGEEGLVFVLNSPVLLENMAAGDVIRVLDDGRFEPIQRGGNVCIQWFRSKPRVTAVEARLTSSVEALGGRLDAEHPGVLVYTIPLRRVGFGAIEAAFNEAVQASPDAGWMFGNVYDPDSGEPLNWWL